GKFRLRRRQHPPEDQILGITELLNAARGRHQRPYSFCFGETRKLKTGAAYGNALITRLPLLAWENYLLPLIRRERRGCRSADLERFTGRRRTYPGILPLLHLDHIYYDHHLRLVDFAVHRSRKALLASDHLPLVADFALA